MKKETIKTIVIFGVTLILLLVTFFVAVNTGGLHTTVSELMKGLFVEYDETIAIIWELRFPRIIVAILGGMIMAVSGVLMQAVMRNPLADPGIIGVSSGSEFAVGIVITFFPSLAIFAPIFSFFGGMIAFAIVYMLASGKEVSPVRIILTGIAIDTFFTGLYQGFETFMGNTYSGAASIVNENISLKTWEDVYILIFYVVISGILCVFVFEKCNLLAFSDKTIIGLGININKLRFVISTISVLMASIFTAIIGSVSFLGLIVPHIARLLVGSNHKKLIPYSALLGR